MTELAPPPAGPGLDAEVRVRRGDLLVDIRVGVAAGGTVALLGPNGAGKTTVVHALAGLLPLESGRVVVNGQVLEDSSAGIVEPPERRPLTVVFQDYLLFPHLSAVQNVAYGLLARGDRRRDATSAALAMLRRFDLEPVAQLHPAQLSGGQAQRVALARALAPAPRLLLLDEPLGALDAQARSAARSQLRRLLAAFEGVAVLVTHDPIDALTLADSVVVMEAGKVVQEGSTAQIAAHPRSRYVADFVGVNLFRGTARGGVLQAGGAELNIAADAEGEVFAVLHPRGVTLHRDRPSGSARNIFSLEVADIEMSGDRARVRLVGDLALVAEVTLGAVEALRLGEGGMAWAEIKATAFTIYPA